MTRRRRGDDEYEDEHPSYDIGFISTRTDYPLTRKERMAENTDTEDRARRRSHRTLLVALLFWAGTLALTALGKLEGTIYGWVTAGLAALASGKWALDKLVQFRWGPKATGGSDAE